MCQLPNSFLLLGSRPVHRGITVQGRDATDMLQFTCSCEGQIVTVWEGRKVAPPSRAGVFLHPSALRFYLPEPGSPLESATLTLPSLILGPRNTLL